MYAAEEWNVCVRREPLISTAEPTVWAPTFELAPQIPFASLLFATPP